MVRSKVRHADDRERIAREEALYDRPEAVLFMSSEQQLGVIARAMQLLKEQLYVSRVETLRGIVDDQDIQPSPTSRAVRERFQLGASPRREIS